MNRSYRVWYLLALVLALTGPAVRLLWWQKTRTQAVDLSMAQAGEVLFTRDWKVKDPLCPEGDGLGPVYNAASCVACHKQGGVGGAGGLQHNVTSFTVRVPGQPTREGIVHARHVKGDAHRETLQHVHPDLPPLAQPSLDQLVLFPGRQRSVVIPAGVQLSQRNTPAVFGAKLIDEIPERVILAEARRQQVRWGASSEVATATVGRALRLPNGRIGRFGWKAQMASLSDFVRAACANELGLGNADHSQPTPIYARASTGPRTIDLTTQQCDQLTAFCASLPRPVERLPKGVTAEQASAGRKLFHAVGCANCHTPKLGTVDGVYSDLLLHTMAQELSGGGYYGDPPVPVPGVPSDTPSPSEWRTPPLWGVADSAPYMHDGRAATLEEAIAMHGGQADRAARNFKALGAEKQGQLIAFLKTLQAP